MPIVVIVLILVVVGFALWLFNQYVNFIDARFKQIINWFVVIATIIWLLKEAGAWDYLLSITV
jgi:hypothetical protein